MVEELQLSAVIKCTASGSGLNYHNPNDESKFVVTAKDFRGQPLRNIGEHALAVESKEADIKSSVMDKKNGSYEVQYSATNITAGEHFSLSVTCLGNPIHGSPFTVRTPQLLLEFSTHGNQSKDWLDAAVQTMSDIPRARLWVQLSDANGSVVYKSTGETHCKWTQNSITAPNEQRWEEKHSNAIRLNNGDRMLIIGKNGWNGKYGGGWGIVAYRPYNIIINAAWDSIKTYRNHRRMVIATDARGLPGWSAPDNLISFSDSGFTQTAKGHWPKFNGTFRIYYEPL